jgi:drug/metabolite transporter (DMT)-like permease
MQIKNRSILLAILACIVWSTAFVGIKIGLRYTTPLHLAGLRFFIAGLLILPFCKNYRANFKTIWKNKWSVLKISFFSTFTLYSLFHIGISMVSASVTALIIGAGPLFIAIFARFINNEALTKRKVLAILTGFSGIAIIALGRFGGLMSAEFSMLGFSILILANFSGSFGNILISNNKIEINPVFLNSIQLMTGGLGILILSMIFESGQLESKPFEFYLALLWLSLIGSIGFSLWFIVLKTPGIKVSEINVWKFIIPVLGVILSWIILPNEHPEGIILAGMTMVALSLVVMYYKKKSK